MPKERSVTTATALGLMGARKLGQPVPESNLVSELKRAWPAGAAEMETRVGAHGLPA
jgi:hypothetical protein